MLLTHNIDYENVYATTRCKLILNKNTLTEKLICQDRVIYEAPICTCLSCFLNDDMEKMQEATQKNIHDTIAAVLSELGVTFAAHEHIYEKGSIFDVNDTINQRLLDVIGYKPVKPMDYTDPNYGYALWGQNEISNIMVCLLGFERMFFYDTFWSVDYAHFQQLSRETLFERLYSYISNIKTDPLCKELPFFCHVFNYTDTHYQFGDCKEIDFDSLEHETRKDFEILRQNYISIHKTNPLYHVRDYRDICVATLHFVIKNGLTINQCENCGRYFIPRNRSDEIYCDSPSPQNSGKTCKQYGATTLCYQRQKDDPILNKCKNLSSAKQVYAKRHSDIAVYAQNYTTFKRESADWKKRYKAGECTAEEFDKWLDEQKERKI